LEFSPRENLLAVLNARQPEVVVVQDPDEDQVDALLTHGYRESRRYRSFPKKGWTSVYRTDWVEQATLQERAEGMRQAERIRDRLGEVGFETDCQSSSHEQTNNEPIEFAAWDRRGPS
jgi:hypothetical protein